MNDQQTIVGNPLSIRPRKTVYVLMYRIGRDFWTCLNTYDTEEQAVKAVTVGIVNCTACRLVRVDGLPIDLPEGEV